MENRTKIDELLSSHSSLARSNTQNLLAGVFSWMFFALCISGVFAFILATNPAYLSLITNPVTGSPTVFGFIVMLSPLGLVLLISFGYQKLSFPLLALIFVVYAILMGMGLSTLLLLYTGASLATTFAISSITFGIMAAVGYTTKTDLTKFGSLLIMALFGIIIASLINFFMHSEGLDYIISFAGVAIFTGLTAYDVQKIKNLSADAELNGWDTKKLTILGALTLYLDFVNLFLFLLRLFGKRR